jgi:hypothetical protein
MANTLITFAAGEGKPLHLHVEMTGEELKQALTGGGTLVRLPTGDDKFVYVNPAHIVTARETTDDPPPFDKLG